MMSETMGLALVAGMVVVSLLQVAVLMRGNRRSEDDERFRTLQETQDKGLMRLERELREELARGRREDAEEAFRDREERAQSANLLSQAVTTQVGQFGTLQAERLEAFARELNRFSLGLDERFERLKVAVETRLTAIQADNANKLEEMRRTVAAFTRAMVSSLPRMAVTSNICGPLAAPMMVMRNEFITVPVL